MFLLHLINGFNFPPIVADAIVDLSKDFFQNFNSGVCTGQILYLAISNEEGPGKSIFDSKHEVILTLDALEDMNIYKRLVSQHTDNTYCYESLKRLEISMLF